MAQLTRPVVSAPAVNQTVSVHLGNGERARGTVVKISGGQYEVEFSRNGQIERRRFGPNDVQRVSS